MRRVLIFCYDSTQFIELMRVARLLKSHGEFEPHFAFGKEYSRREENQRTCEENNISYCRFGDWKTLRPGELPFKALRLFNPFTLPQPFRWIYWRYDDLKQRLNEVFLVKGIRRYKEEIKTAIRFIDDEKPALLVFAEDNLGYGTEILIHVAKDRGIRSVIMPFTICNALEIANHIQGESIYSFQRLENRIVGSIYPKWTYRHNGKRMLRLPASRIVAIEKFKMAPPNPWMFNSGAAAAIATESQAMLEYYRKEGLPDHQLVVVGALYDDVLARSLKDARHQKEMLYQELELDGEKPLVLVSLPSFLLGKPLSRSGFISSKELYDFYLGSLSKLSRFNVVIRLHPSMNPEEYRPIIQKHDLKMSTRDTATLVPLCDLFVATISATIRWAIACGKPVINFDVYRFRYEDYIGVPGCLPVEEPSEFIQTMLKLNQDAQFYADLAAKQRSAMTKWGNLDGRAGERVLELFGKLA